MPQVSSSAFQRAFVAMSYTLGQRGEGLLKPLGTTTSEAQQLAQLLAQSDRNARAATLGRELTRIAEALTRRAYR